MIMQATTETSVPLLVAPGPSAFNLHQQELDENEEEEQQQQQQYQGPTSSRNNRKPRQHKRYQQQQQQQQQFRRQKSNRLLAQARGSKLIENFSEFLASRNVINSCSRYDKVVDDVPQTPATRDRFGRVERRHHHHGQQQPQKQKQKQPIFRCDQLKTARYHGSGAGDAGCFYNASCSNTCFSVKSGKQSRLIFLIGALMSRNQGSKASVLVKLLRLPVVLAALFSLILAATLLTLYSMSFHNHNQQSYSTAFLHHQEIGIGPTAGGNLKSSEAANHHINSRHLSQLPSVIIGLEENPTDGRVASRAQGDNGYVDVDGDEDEDDDESPESATKMAGSPMMIVNDSTIASDGFDRALTVQTECGAFVGKPENSAIVFSGIPYASPPIGLRRWTRPRPVWLDARLCQRNRTSLAGERRSHCAQLSPVTRRFTGHEDCLYLDIFSPKLDQVQKLPVMVYIHGGFLAFGSSGQGRVNWMKAQPGGQLAAELNVVLVAFNYRLQALGFMTLLQLAQNNGPDGSEGNYGLWDQLVALNWIKRNIESFGGDPDNIVLFGPDSASALPLALLTGQGRGGGGGDESSGAGQEWRSTAAVGQPPIIMEPHRGAAAGRVVGPQTTGQRRHWLEGSRDLFRAVWLTNPTVYYEMPYELANSHYQRLFLDSSPCQALNSPSSNNNNNDNNNGNIKPVLPPPLGNDNDGPKGDNGTRFSALGGGGSGSEAITGGSNQVHAKGDTEKEEEEQQQQSAKRLLQCLMNLTAEQVVRHYLGQDDPSYRLDDQNSLPIHGVFADQFVTIDRELVQNSYPFSLQPQDQKWQQRGQQQQKPASGSGKPSNLNQAKANYPPWPSPIENNQTSGAHYDNSGKPKANETTGFASSRFSSVSFSGGGGGGYNDDYDDDNCVGPICAQGGKDLLLGSTAQAVEYWPCPRDLHQWTWDDFKRYVNISLNSFITDTYKRASHLYGVPMVGQEGGGGAADGGDRIDIGLAANHSSPIETYLTMVSDIRQTCPINELAASLGSRRHRVHRYIVENKPTGNRLTTQPDHQPLGSNGFLELKSQQKQQQQQATPAPSITTATTDAAAKQMDNNKPQEQHHHKQVPNYAFHTWDLMAFFGFEFEPHYEPSAEDLKFQSQFRAMVRRFVHREQMDNDKRDDFNVNEKPDIVPSGIEPSAAADYTIFGKGATKSRLKGDGHKLKECRMWRQHLGQSYAWVS